MTIRNREEAALAAEATKTNIPNFCQGQTRAWFLAPSVGDFDHDGAADAEDGWKSEPPSARHTDRKPPRGTPVAWLGGSKDNGHRAMSLGPDASGVYHIRSTDAGGLGVVATVPLDWPEKEWGLTYAGWSETISGIEIPLPPEPQTRGPQVDAAIEAIKTARDRSKPGGSRESILKKALRILRQAPSWPKRRK